MSSDLIMKVILNSDYEGSFDGKLLFLKAGENNLSPAILLWLLEVAREKVSIFENAGEVYALELMPKEYLKPYRICAQTRMRCVQRSPNIETAGTCGQKYITMASMPDKL